MKKGMIMNIQKYSVHDGPGIRTTVFFKGCPLKCWWCHNPESQNPKAEIMYYEDRCTLCGNCIKYCSQGVLTVSNNEIIRDKEKCTLCEKCTDYCFDNAIEVMGREMTEKEVIKEIEKDRIFYEESNGGVTFSGGEPFMQFDFLNRMIDICKKRGIHTAVDTCGFVEWDKLKIIAEKVDLFLFDLKHMDEESHIKYTGVSNKLILDNLQKLSKVNNNIYLRIPIIPTINDHKENLEKTKKFIGKLNIKQVNLLPYHKIGSDKYGRVGMEYKIPNIQEPSDEFMEKLKEDFSELGVKIKIGG